MILVIDHGEPTEPAGNLVIDRDTNDHNVTLTPIYISLEYVDAYDMNGNPIIETYIVIIYCDHTYV
jgi:hypothetical protein